MKRFTIALALILGCFAASLIGQEECLTGNCPLQPRSVQVQPQAQVVRSESPVIVQSSPVRQPVRRVFANRPVRTFLKRVFCR